MIKVLLIEGRPGDLDLLRGCLAPAAGFTLVNAESLTEAWPVLEATPTSIALLSFDREANEGLQELERLHAALPAVPAIVLISQPSRSFIQHALQSGARDVLRREEVAEDMLLRTLRQALVPSYVTPQDLLGALPASIALVNASGIIIAVNAAWLNPANASQLKGPEIGIGQSYLAICEAVAGEGADAAHQATDGLRRILDGHRQELTFEYHSGTDAALRWFQLVVAPLRSELPRGAVITHLDITGRRTAEEALRQSEVRFQSLVDSGTALATSAVEITGVGTWEYALHSQALTWSSETRRIFGIGLKDWVGTMPGFLELVHPEDRQTVLTALDTALTAPTPVEMEYRIIRPDGSLRVVHDRAEGIRDAAGQLTHVGGFVIDSTERKQNEDRLRHSRALLQIAGRVVRAGLWAIDLPDLLRTWADDRRRAERELRLAVDGLREAQRIAGIGSWELRLEDGVLTWSDEMFRIFQPGPGQFTGTVASFLAKVHPEDRAAVVAAQQAAERGEGALDIEYRLVTPGGAVRHIRGRGELFPADAERPRRLTGTTQDITSLRRLEDAQLATEARFQQLADSIEEVFWLSDLATDQVIYVSPAFEKLWGRRCAELYGSSRLWLEAIHPDDQPRVAAAIAASRATGAYSEEYRIVRPDGTVRWVADRAFPIRNTAGEIYRIAGVALDITDDRAAATTLRVSEERFRLLAKATSGAVWDWDIDHNSLWWNEGFETLFGYRRDEVDPTLASWTSNIHPDDRPRVVRRFHEIIAQGDSNWSDEYRFLHKDGSASCVLDRGYVIRDDTGRAVRVVGGMADLTERRKTEATVAQQAALIDEARDAIVVLGLDYRVVFWSKGAERLYGWTREAAAGQSLDQLIHFDQARFHEACNAVLTAGHWSGEGQKQARDGSSLTMDCRWTLMRDPHGQPKSILTIDTDVTERKQLEQQFLRSQRMESIGTLAGGIAHDLNNVLTPILLSIELLKTEPGVTERLEMLDTIESSARRGAGMIRQLLSFARGLEGERHDVSVGGLLREVARIVRDTFPKNIQVRTIIPDDVWTAIGDTIQLHQVLLNLCVNARDAMPDGGVMVLAVGNVRLDENARTHYPEALPGPHVMIEVRDTGVGMTRDILERIFEPFFTTKEIGKGTGLGLSTSLAIIKSHTGVIRVTSVPGEGTTVQIHLPARSTPVPEEPMTRPSHLRRGHGEQILVVDDEASVCQIARQTLEAFGYRVLIAKDGAEAVALFAQRETQIDVVLMDMMMPVMDGAGAAQVLRSIHPGVRILATTGLTLTNENAVPHGSETPHLLMKPYTAEELLTALREVLDEPPHPAPLPQPVGY